MRRMVMVAGMAGLLVCAAGDGRAVEEPAATSSQEEQVVRLLAQLKQQAATAKDEEHKVTVPVATAGARGAEVKAANRLAVIWPKTDVSPLSALVRNLDAGMQTNSMGALAPQVATFLETYPEYANDPLVKQLSALFKKAAETEGVAETR